VGPLAASARVPTSKSLTNRALVAAAVANGGRVASPLECEDTRLLAGALEAAGWAVTWGAVVEVGPRRAPSGTVSVDLGNSGTGVRLLLALLAAVPGSFVVDGSPRLRERPMAPLLDALEGLGAALEPTHGGLPVRLDGRRLRGGRVELRPGVSSQFASALLMAAPLMDEGLELELRGPIPSRPYLDLTRDVLERFGATVSSDPSGMSWRVAPGPLRPTTERVEGDWSAAAFFLAAAAVAGGSVQVAPLDERSRQGDRRVCEILAGSGVEIAAGPGEVSARGPARGPLIANLAATPDLFPALAAVAATAPPGSRLEGLGHLRHKESDRLAVMVGNLRRLGAVLEEDGTTLRVLAPASGAAGNAVSVESAGDHRIAMAMAVAALRLGPLALDDGDCVQKSFPGFWTAWERLLP
jgi:3-phosphoshikimate 1-carboxyvinyltransferase